MFRSRIPQIAAKLEAEMRAAETAGAEIVALAAKARVPVDSGRLRDAIHVEQDDGGAMVVAGNSDVFYGHIIEHGGAHSAAHPFLIPAAEESRAEIIGIAAGFLRSL